MASLTKPQPPALASTPHHPVRANLAETSPLLQVISAATPDSVFSQLESSPEGLATDEVEERLATYGANVFADGQASPLLPELWGKVKNPLNGLLLSLALLSWLLSDIRSAVVIATMVVLSVGLGFVQEHRSNSAAAKLAKMVRVHVSVKRRGMTDGDQEGFFSIPLDGVVPGDVVKLSAGDMLPADLRLLTSNDLFVNQSALTGESMPIEKGRCRRGHGR
jgi:Mg2+-importing ATPase